MTAVRLAVAGLAPLSPDEAYYWVWSRALAPGYLDHPPMVALWIRAGTALAGDGAFGVRLLAPLSAAAGSVLLWRAAEDLLPGAGVRAAILLNATLLMAAGAVTMTPDTPLLFFWTATLFAMGRLVRTGRAAWWVLAGVSAGAALASKYTAGLLGLGLALWLVMTPAGRRWLRTPWPWAGGALALACFAPVVAWNAAHDWASFAKQGGRNADFHIAAALGHLGELVGGQIGLATPLIFALCCAGTAAALRRWREPGCALLAALVAPGAALFLEHALGDRVQANWPAVLYPAACVAAAGLGWQWWRWAVWLGGAASAAMYAAAVSGWTPLPPHADPIARQLAGWEGLAAQVAAMHPAFVAADNYGVAAELARALPVPVLGAEPRWALFALPRLDLAGEAGLLVRSARRSGPPDAAPWSTIAPAGSADRMEDGAAIERYDLFRVVARGDMVALPHR